MNLDISVVGIRLARQQRLDLAAPSLHFQSFEQVEPFLFGRHILLRFGEFDERDRIKQFIVKTAERTKSVFELGALAHDFLRGFGIVPKIGIFGFGVQFGQAAGGSFDVKDASSAIPSIA
jgi:hypothetical protein